MLTVGKIIERFERVRKGWPEDLWKWVNCSFLKVQVKVSFVHFFLGNDVCFSTVLTALV